MKSNNLFLGKDSLSVLEAMRKIDENASGILFLVNDNNRLIGCITDGDIRRFLLSGGSVSDSVLSAANRKPKVAYSIDDARKLYHKKNYIAIPILDDSDTVIDVFNDRTDEKTQKHNPLKLPVVINAGGKGTRLDPITRVLPKPLIPVGDLPIIEHIIKEYESYLCTKFHIIVNYKRDLLKAYFADNDNKYDITWYDEDKPLGTGGGLSLLKGKLKETFFFANCDALLTADYKAMYEFHKKNNNIITMICAYKSITIPYGVIDMGINGSIEKMEEKPAVSFLTNTGIYIVEPEVLLDIEDDIPIGFPEIVEKEKKKGKRVAAFPVSENDWMDMGQFPELEQMSNKFCSER